MAMFDTLSRRINNVYSPAPIQTQAQKSLDRIYGSQTTAGQAPKSTSLNPFISRRTGTVNEYVPQSVWQGMIDNGRNAQVKQYVSEATGLKPTQTAASGAAGSYAGGPYSDTGFSFNNDADENNLFKMDVKTELPKISANQISAIISKHFGNSPVIKPSDAQGIFEAQQKSGMSALAILGIGALESGYGTSNIAKQKNNLWGWNATNINPGGNAADFSQVGTGALEFANKYLNTYYNNYGAKSIYDAGTGNNPKGKGYAYNNDGSISTTWANSINSIMKNFYNTAKQTGGTSAAGQAFGGSTGGNKAVNIAKQFIGTPYLWGGTTPKGFDCSGLMQYAYKQMGISIPRVSQDQFKSGTAVDKSQLAPGDLVFFKGASGTAAAPGHVGMYIGGGQFLQAPKTGDVVKISDLSSRNDYVGARRYTN